MLDHHSLPPRRAASPGRILAIFLAAAAFTAPLAAAPKPSNSTSGSAQSWVDVIRKDAPRTKNGECLDVRYEGDLDFEGHFRRPGQTLRYHSVRRFVSNGRGAVRLDWTTWLEGDSTLVPESFLIVDGTAYHRDSPAKPWEILSGEPAHRAALQAWSGLPWEFLLQPIPRDAKTLDVESGGATVHTIMLPVVGVRHRRLAIQGSRLLSLDELWPHPRLGDVQDEARYAYGTTPFPDSITLALNERDQRWRLAEHRVSARTDAREDSMLTKPVSAALAKADEDSMTGEPEIVSIAPGVWAADMADLDTRSLIVEFASNLAVIECAVGSANGERLVDAIKRRWPNKPIRYALFSHYHPHYAGGLRALIAEGATVITTTGNEDFARSIGQYRFGLAPDRLQRSGNWKVDLQTFRGRYEIADSTQRLVLLDIGDRSDHTDEFVVFWLPKSGIVFEAEQGWFTSNGTLKATRRAERFMQTLDDLKVQYDHLVQSWPMRGTEREVTKAQLAELVRKRKNS